MKASSATRVVQELVSIRWIRSLDRLQRRELDEEYRYLIEFSLLAFHFFLSCLECLGFVERILCFCAEPIYVVLKSQISFLSKILHVRQRAAEQYTMQIRN